MSKAMIKRKIDAFDDIYEEDETISSATTTTPAMNSLQRRAAAKERARIESGEGQIIDIKLTSLHTFKNHPFKVRDDEDMEKTMDSIKKHGILTPVCARPRTEGGYEILSGHRRVHASKRLGKETVPCYVRNYDDDEATIIMVESNIQRTHITVSEKAKSYAMWYEAMKHQGKKGDGRYVNSLHEISAESGESKTNIQTYISLANLKDELLEMIDNQQITILAGSKIAKLKANEQEWLLEILTERNVKLKPEQAQEIKELSEKKKLTKDAIIKILFPTKEKKKKPFAIKEKEIRKYFPKDYSNAQMQQVIFSLLEQWQKDNM